MFFADKPLGKVIALVLLLLLIGGVCMAQEITESPRPRLNTGGHNAAVHSLFFTEDQRLISCGLDKAVRVHALNSDDTDVWRYQIGDGFIGQFFAAALNPNVPHQLAVGSSGSGLTQSDSDAGGKNDSDILLTDYVTGKQTGRLKGHKSTITGLAFAPHANLLASCGTDGKTLLWDLTTARVAPRTLSDRGEYVTGVAFSPDGRWLAASAWRADEDEHFSTVRVWEIGGTRAKDGTLDVKSRSVFKWNDSDVLCVAWSKQGLLAYGSSDGLIQMRDARNNFAWQPPLTVPNDSVSCLAFSPDGTRLLSGGGREGRDVAVRVWTLDARGPNQKYTETQRFNRHSTTVHSVAFSQDGTRAASGDAFGAVYVWKVKQKAWEQLADDLVRSFKGPGNPVFSVAWSPLGDKLAWGDVFGRTAPEHVFDLTYAVPEMDAVPDESAWKGATTSWVDSRKAGDSSAASFRMLQALPDASGVIVRDSHGRASQRIKLGPADKLHCFSFTPDGKVVVGSDLYLARYDVSGSKTRRECIFEGHEGPVISLSVSPDGRYLASGGVDQTVRVWNLHPAPGAAETMPDGQSVNTPPKPSGNAGAASRQIVPPSSGADLQVSANTSPEIHPETARAVIYPLLSIFDGEGGVWAAWAQNGYYVASADGDDVLGWHINKGENSAAEFRTSYQCQQFYQPDVIRQLTATGGLKPARKVVFKNGLPPGLDTPIQEHIARVPELISMQAEAGATQLTLKPDDTFKTDTDQVTLICRFQSPDPSLTIDVTLNYPGARPLTIPATRSRGWGKVVPLSPGLWQISVPQLTAGRNEVRIVAQNGSGSSEIPLQITYTPPSPASRTLHVFAIGISDYNVEDLKLQYADKDAKAILDFFQENGKSLYQDVKLYSMLNRKATRANIEAGLQELAKEVSPQDTVLLFFACHGFTATDRGEKKFYLAPTDIAFDASKRPKNGVAWQTILDSLAGVQAARIVLLVDHCFAGGVNQLLVQAAGSSARSQTQTQTLRDLRRNNLFVFSASGPTEFSYEDDALKQGVFTAAVLEALRGGMEANLYRDGVAMLDALDFWVPRKVASLNSGKPRAQHPTLFALPNADKEVPLAKAPEK